MNGNNCSCCVIAVHTTSNVLYNSVGYSLHNLFLTMNNTCTNWISLKTAPAHIPVKLAGGEPPDIKPANWLPNVNLSNI